MDAVSSVSADLVLVTLSAPRSHPPPAHPCRATRAGPPPVGPVRSTPERTLQIPFIIVVEDAWKTGETFHCDFIHSTASTLEFIDDFR
jgi:hypothetical protein